MKTHNRERVNSIIGAQDQFNRDSATLLEQLKKGEITVDQYEREIESLASTLEALREKLSR